MRLVIMLCVLLSSPLLAKDISVSSPDKRLNLMVSDQNGIATYRLDKAGNSLIRDSKLGFTFRDAPPLYKDFTVSEISRSSHDSSWQQPWGEQQTIRDQHNELLVRFAQKDNPTNQFTVRFRLFNDGIGFRYEVPAEGQRIITRELTEFALADSHKAMAFWIPAQNRDRQEYLYHNTPLQDVALAQTPFTVVYENGTHVAIHEAALVDYAGMSLKRYLLGTFIAELAPRSDGSKVHKSGSFITPWRTITVADDAPGLANSFIGLNLNEPAELDDTSWIMPGKYIGIWWCMHITKCTWGSGPKHGATTKRTIDYMQFASEHGFDGVLVEGWNVGWDGNWIANSELFSFTQPYEDFDIAAISQFGKQHGVRLIGHHETSGGITNYEEQMQEAFAFYQRYGVTQVKTGYVAFGQNLKQKDAQGVMRDEFTDSQPVVNHFLHNVKTAANYQISINTHEAVKDTGLRRTYPNWISRESARGQEYNAGWATPNPPNHLPTLVFTRMLAGPMDFTPGIFDFDYPPIPPGGEEFGLSDIMRPHSTLAKQLAEYVVIYSPIQMAADLPENYLKHPRAFQFIKDVPTDWQTSQVLQGEVGEFVVTARQEKRHRHYSGNDWYVGALTGEAARIITLPLTFLDATQRYEAQIYRDGEQADWRANPYAMIIETKTVTAKDVLTLPIAVAGGFAIRFKQL